MVLTKEERCELLVKARAKKKELSELKKKQAPTVVAKEKAKKNKEPTRTLDLSVEELLEDPMKKKDDNVEIKNEVIRIKAPKKKTIIKRVIEVEEPSSEEEIQEEIIKVPRKSAKQPILDKVKPPTNNNNNNNNNEPAYLKYIADIFPRY